jgi:hypothetical protein
VTTGKNSIGASSPEGPAPVTRKDLVIALVVALLATFFHLLYFNHGVHNLMDLGVLAVDSARILEGQVYGLDFQAPYGPARYHLIALTFLLFGQSIHVLNCLFLVVMAVNNALIFLSARYLASRPFALFAALLGAVAHGSIHKGFFILAGLLVLHGLLSCLAKPGNVRALRFGIVAGIAILLRWDVGVIGLAAAALLWIFMALSKEERARRKLLPELLCMAAGIMILCLPVTLALVLFSDPGAIVTHGIQRVSGVEWVLTDFTSWSELFGSPDTRARLFAVLVVILALSMLACVLIALRGLRRPEIRPFSWMLLALFLVGVPLLNQVHIQIRFNRLLHSAPPFFIALAYLLSAASLRFRSRSPGAIRNMGRMVPPLLCAGFLALILVYLWNFTGLASQDSFAALRYEERYVSHPRIKCHMRKGIAKDLEAALAFMEERLVPEEYFFADPSCTLFYFLAERPNPTPYSDWLYYWFNPPAEQAMIEGLEDPEARLYVSWPQRPVSGIPFREACPKLHGYLSRTFETVQRGRRFVFMERVRDI